MKSHLAYCKVNISPVRAENRDASEMVTQLLFGEIFHVHEITGSWCKITTFLDNYDGWIDLKHLSMLTAKEASRWMDTAVLEGNLFSQVETPWGVQYITRGGFIPAHKSGEFNIGDDIFNYRQQNREVAFRSIAEMATSYLNTPYLWGGKNPFGIDCSGFTQIVYRYFDYNLPRDASQQAEHGRTIAWEEAEANDLAFFQNEAGKIIHVGIILESKKIIHASGQVRIDTLRPQGIYNETQQLLTHTLSNIKRL